jgi:hypothetical protein
MGCCEGVMETTSVVRAGAFIIHGLYQRDGRGVQEEADLFTRRLSLVSTTRSPYGKG